MINLLPPQEKQRLILINKEKLIAIWAIIVLVSMTCFVLILLSIELDILTGVNYQKDMLVQTERAIKTQDFVSLNNTIQRYNKTLGQIDSFMGQKARFSQALRTITDISSPAVIRLTALSLSKGKNGEIQVSISGVSDTRDDLLVFKKNIQQSPKIENPYFSPDSWVNQKNPSFSLTFSINEQ